MAGLSAVPASLSSNLGFVKWTSNAELDRLEADKILSERQAPGELLDELSQHVRRFWESAKSAKLQVEQEMISILRQIAGEYEPDKLQAIQTMGGSDDFIRLTYHKVRDAESWMLDILNPMGDRTWDIQRGLDPDIPPDILAVIKQRVQMTVMQQAMSEFQATGQPVDQNMLLSLMQDQEDEVSKMVKKQANKLAEERTTNMENTIVDQLNAGGWPQAFRACIADLARLKACVIKGPIYRREKKLKWVEDPQTGEWVAEVAEEITPMFARVSPFDWYPAGTSIGVDDGDGIELEHLTISDLKKLIGVPGYKEDAVRAAILMYSKGHRETTPIDAERFYLEKDNTSGLFDEMTNKIDLINYWGNVLGKTLIEWGMKKEDIPDPGIDYQVNVKMIGKYVIKAVLNPDPLGLKPYGVTSFSKSNDSQWGECPAELMTDLQGICNASVRALVNNIAYASGPITEIDIDRLAPGESPDIWPWKNIQTTNKRMQTGKAVQFYQANMMAQELIAVYDKFKREADDMVIPAYGHGNSEVGGAGKTSSGLAMLMGAAARNIKMAIANVDMDIIVPAINRLFNYNMRFNPDKEIKGDMYVRARGAGGLLVKEQLAMRRNEFRTTLGPVEQQIMGVKGVAYVLGENIKALEMDINRAIPNMSEIEKELPDALPTQAVNPAAPPSEKPANLDNAGQPVQGQDAALFHQGGGE